MNKNTLWLRTLLFLCLPLLLNISFAAHLGGHIPLVYDVKGDAPGGTTHGEYDEKKKKNKKWILPAIAVGAVAVALIHNSMSKSPDTPENEASDTTDPQDQELTKKLRNNGPDFSHLYNMSAFMITGLVKGDWPLVIDFEHHQPGYVELMIRTKTSETFRYRLDGGETGHRHIVLPLPASFGNEPVPALIAITATTSKGSDQTLASFRLLGLGAGPRAVGSVAIDKVTIASDKIQSSLGQTAAYSFYSHSNFENAAVDFMKVIDESDGEQHEWINKQSLNGGVTENKWIGEKEGLNWDGKDHQSKPSMGAHKLQVRVWHTKGDWVSAWSNSALFVAK
jgi:hypothetical protein